MQDRTVLVVDNNEDIRELLKHYFESCGCRVCEAENGERAIRLTLELRPQLILMDLAMPKMDGLTATRRIKELEEVLDVPIVVLSSYIFDEETKLQAIEAGADDCFSKPYDVDNLKFIVSKYIPDV